METFLDTHALRNTIVRLRQPEEYRYKAQELPAWRGEAHPAAVPAPAAAAPEQLQLSVHPTQPEAQC